jgi:hypothetical protein
MQHLGLRHLVMAFVAGVTLAWASCELTSELRATPLPQPAPPPPRYVYLPQQRDAAAPKPGADALGGGVDPDAQAFPRYYSIVPMAQARPV